MVDYTVENRDSSIIRVFVVRHGQTEWNIEKILQGHKDIPLNEEGHKQAKLLGDRLKDIKFDCWVSSDLTRCIQTTKGIEDGVGIENVPKRFIKSAAFRERFMGEVQGMKIADAKEKYGENYRNLGETKEELIDRIYKRWIEVLKECCNYNDKNVLLCTHGGVIRNFINYLYKEKKYKLAPNMTEDDLRLPYNTSITVVDVPVADIAGVGTINKFGCTLHLGEQFEVSDKDLR